MVRPREITGRYYFPTHPVKDVRQQVRLQRALPLGSAIGTGQTPPGEITWINNDRLDMQQAMKISTEFKIPFVYEPVTAMPDVSVWSKASDLLAFFRKHFP